MAGNTTLGFWSWAQKDPDRLALVIPEAQTYTFGKSGRALSALSLWRCVESAVVAASEQEDLPHKCMCLPTKQRML